MNIILIGPPGCGKGTQAERICHKYGLTYISTGNIIREEIAARTPIGIRAKALIDSGHFLDDQTVLEFVKKACAKVKTGGVLFDGFPRTRSQAFALSLFLHVDTVLDIQVGEAEVIRRISSRWMVDVCEGPDRIHTQHTFVGKADADKFVAQHGGRAFQRDDDKAEVVAERLRVYHEMTEPVIEFYGRAHCLYIINGEKSIDNVWDDIVKVLDRERILSVLNKKPIFLI